MSGNDKHTLRSARSQSVKSLEASDYMWVEIIGHIASVLRQARTPIPLETLAHELRTRHTRPGDFTRAAFQIDGSKDEDIGAARLAEWAIGKLHRHVSNGDGGYTWQGGERVTIDKRQIDLYSDTYREEQRRHQLATRWADPRQNRDDPITSDWLAEIQAERLERPDDELRTSLRAHRFLPDFPIIRDQTTGRIVVGNRRLKLCKELGITPVIVERNFSNDQQGRMEKMRLFIASNEGGQGWTAPQRKQIMRNLEMSGWTVEAIAAAFQVSPRTVRRETAEGRTDDKANRDEEIRSLHARGYTQREIAERVGASKGTVSRALEDDVPHSGHDGQNGAAPQLPLDEPPPKKKAEIEASERADKVEGILDDSPDITDEELAKRINTRRKTAEKTRERVIGRKEGEARAKTAAAPPATAPEPKPASAFVATDASEPLPATYICTCPLCGNQHQVEDGKAASKP